MKRIERLSIPKLLIWAATVCEIGKKEALFYFNTSSGYQRCKADAEKGDERALKYMALFGKKILLGETK